MLILTRKPGEIIRIGDDIIVTLLGVSGQQVRLGIDAPAGVAVHRQEIYERIQAEKAQSASVGSAQVNQEAEFCIDDHIQMVADARRYRWLRDVAFDTPRQDLVPRDRMHNLLIEQDLDGEIDRAMKAYPGEQEVEPCAQ